jgi:hypothetical protein
MRRRACSRHARRDYLRPGRRCFAELFRGITTDGHVIPDLFVRKPEGAPTQAMIDAVGALLARLTPAQKAATCFPVGSEQWRHWQNTELYVENYGLRLDEVAQELRDGVMAVLRASLSTHGYELSRDVMRPIDFSAISLAGQLCSASGPIFCLFGEPSMSEPGWQLFGHHLSLNCFVLGEQMVLTPASGRRAELADHGPFSESACSRTRARRTDADALASAQRCSVPSAHSMMGGDLPEGRRHFADNLHLAAPSRTIVLFLQGPTGSAPQRQQRRASSSCRNTLACCRAARVPRGLPRSSGISRRRISAGSAVSRRRARSTTASRAR